MPDRRRTMGAFFFLSITLLAASLALPCREAGRWTSHGPYGGVSGDLVIAGAGGEILFAPAWQLLKSEDRGRTWKSLGLGWTSHVACDREGRTVYAATDNTVLRSGDGGTTWSATGIGTFSVDSLAVSPWDPDMVYAGAFDSWDWCYLAKSIDGGDTWTSSAEGLPNFQVTDIVFDRSSPGTLYICILGQPGGVFRSRDWGASWTWLGLMDSARRVAVDPRKPKFLYAWIEWALWKSRDAGASWKRVNPKLFDYHVWTLALDESSPKTLYAGLQEGQIYRSRDRGATWRYRGEVRPYFVNQILVDPADGKHLYLTRERKLYSSSDGGRTWGLTSLSASGLHCVVARSGAEPALYAGSVGSGLFESLDGGASWALTGVPAEGIRALLIPDEPGGTIFAGTPWAGVYKSADGGVTWSEANDGLSQTHNLTALVGDPGPGGRIFAGGFEGLFRTENGGASWEQVDLRPLPPGVSAAFVDPRDPLMVLIGVNQVGIARSTDGGNSWLPVAITGIEKIVAFAADPARSGVFYAGGLGVLKSTDSGVTWRPAGLSQSYVSSILVDPSRPNRVFAGIDYQYYHPRKGVYVSEDGGETWAPLGDGLPDATVSGLAIDPQDPCLLHASLSGAYYYGEQGWLFSMDLDP